MSVPSAFTAGMDKLRRDIADPAALAAATYKYVSAMRIVLKLTNVCEYCGTELRRGTVIYCSPAHANAAIAQDATDRRASYQRQVEAYDERVAKESV